MVQGWWCNWLVERMTGRGGGKRRKMDKGGGTEENAFPVSTAPAATNRGISAPEGCLQTTGEDSGIVRTVAVENSVDFFTQASKALTLRSPFDLDESTQASSSGASGNAGGVSSALLPGSCAQFLLRHSDSRSKHKKSHSGHEHKKRPEKSRGSTFWNAMEAYFRELTVDDIDRICWHSSLGFCNSNKCFYVPLRKVASNAENSDNVSTECYLCRMGNLMNLDNTEPVGGGGLNDRVMKEEGIMEDNEQEHMDVDIVGGVNEMSEQPKEGDLAVMDPSEKKVSMVEWLLGSRNKIYLTTERPSKKRKLLGGDAGLEKILVAHPTVGSSSLCHYCCLGDLVSQSNQLITCTSCGMVVHQICYGVHSYLDEKWLCSWCKHKSDHQNGERPCLLCPKGGGALKPVKRERDEHLLNYAHLFCCQWMPEVYVENTKMMEPIMNMAGIQDTRRKLICYLCKVKYGACVRCSNGACRTSFHPICAREAGHRMEIWGRLGCDEVELRAFCSKHSEIHSNVSSHSVVETLAPISSDSVLQPAAPPGNMLNNGKDSSGNRDKFDDHVGVADFNVGVDMLNNGVLHRDGPLDNKLNLEIRLKCLDQQLTSNCAGENETVENVNGSCSNYFVNILKQLIDQEKVDLKDVAADLGVSAEALAPLLAENHAAPGMCLKLAEWLQNHGYTGSSLEKSNVKLKFPASHKVEAFKGGADTNAVIAAESGNGSLVPVKIVPPRGIISPRGTKNDTRILRNDESMSTSNEMSHEDRIIDGVSNCLTSEEGFSSKESSDDIEKRFLSEASRCQDILGSKICEAEGERIIDKAVYISDNEPSNEVAKLENNTSTSLGVQNSACLDLPPSQGPDIIKLDGCNSFIHPLIRQKLVGMDDGQEYDGDRKSSQFGASSSSGFCCSRHNQQRSDALVSKIYGSKFEQLVKARNMGLQALSPASEVEGELIFYQQKLLSNADRKKRLIDGLVSSVSENLQREIDFARRKQWDAVLLSQYLHELREVKKQGRKERRNQEAQAILAAATAAAAASSRVSSLRKDTLSESAHVEQASNLRASNGRAGTHQNSRVKETPSRSAAIGISSDKQSGILYVSSDPSVEHPRMCDICQRCETILNPILVCSSCKVAVHLDCYRNVRKSSGPWFCELCEELLVSRGSAAVASNSLEKPYFVAECGLCGGTAGAFRKSSNGQWIHAFCAEWVLDSKITRGQVHPMEGMETVSKGGDLCAVCGRRQGVCIKCSYGNCQSTFHPSCARSTGFYMNVRSIGVKPQRKAYCGKHSMEQRTKAEAHKHGVEEFNRLRQVRVELERLRLLCERISKREKLKREVVLCSHDIVSSKRDNTVLTAISQHNVCHTAVSSESATTSTRGYTDGNKSGSDTVQRSDDLTVDSTVAGKRRVKILTTIDSDQKTDDSSVSQHMTPKPAERVSFSGKHIPGRPPCSWSTLDDAENRERLKKQSDTLEKELIMTSDQASMKNQRLPKGFVYVPLGCLAKEKESAPDAFSQER